MDDFDSTMPDDDGEPVSSIPPEDLIPEKRGPGRPKGSKNKPKTDDPEGIPEFSTTDEPPRKRRGRPPGSKNRAKGGTKLPIPPSAIAALGNAPYMLVGQLYAVRTGRSLDFTNPEQVAVMHRASLDALAAWMNEAGVEAPAWLVYAGTTAMCMGAAISIDQMKMKAEKAVAESSKVKPVSVKASEAAVAKPVVVVQNDGSANGSVPTVVLDDSDKRASA